MNDNRYNEKFTAASRKALQHAEEEAHRLQHTYVGTEHLLLGLLYDDTNEAHNVLHTMNVDLNEVRKMIEFIVTRADRIIQTDGTKQVLQITPRGKKALELAVEEAHRLSLTSVETDFLLLGLIREGEGIAAGVLESQGVNLKKAHNAILTLRLKQQQAAEEAATTASRKTQPDISVEPRRIALVQTQSQQLYESYPFTEQAHRILASAEDGALHLDHAYIGSEHLLLGILDVIEGAGSVALQNLGVDQKRVREAIVFIIGPGERFVQGPIPLTPRSKIILKTSFEMAQIMSSTYVGSEHLLLGLLEQEMGMARGILESMGVNKEVVLPELARVMKQATYE